MTARDRGADGVSMFRLCISKAPSAAGLLTILSWQLDCIEAVVRNVDEEETGMDSNYVFLCGVMWCRFGLQDAGKELLRAAHSDDPDMKTLACAMFAKGVGRFRELGKRTQSIPPRSLG